MKIPSVVFQVSDRLVKLSEEGIGKSRQLDKQEGRDPNLGIRSYATLKTYIQHGCDYAKWAKTTHGCKYIDDANNLEYINEYLALIQNKQKEDGSALYSASTIKTKAASIAKLYQRSTKDFIETAPRYRQDIQRSRRDCARDSHYSLDGKHADYIRFCKCFGPRANKEAVNLRGSDLEEKNGKLYMNYRQGKGGKARAAEFAGSSEDLDFVKNLCAQAGNDKLFSKIPSIVDTHGLRAIYATRMYNKYARPLDTLSKKEKYYCRFDMRGVVYDRQAMKIASESLGHNRINVIASHYLWNQSEV